MPGHNSFYGGLAQAAAPCITAAAGIKSVNPKSPIGYGAYLAVLLEAPYSQAFKADVVVKKFGHTSSTKLEIKTLIWAFASIQKPVAKIVVYTDSQNHYRASGKAWTA